ncbi:MAG TPA: PDZ domain-containing protein [Pyrinomonadaceae bacterium]
MTKKAVLTLSGLLLLTQGHALRAQDTPAAPPSPSTPAVAAVAPAGPPPQAAAVVAPAPPAQGVSAVSVPQAAPPTLAPAQAPPPSAVLAPAPPTHAVPAMAYAPAPPQGPGEVTIFHFGDNFLGVSVEDVTRENMGRYNQSGEPRGVGVRSVVKGGPAEKAGLRENDVILRFDGETVTTTRKLNRLLGESAPEHTARLTIRRGGGEQEISVTLGKREFGREFGGTMIDGELWRRQAEEMSRNSEQWKRQGEEARRKMEEWQRKNPGGVFTFFGGGRRVGISTNALGKQLADYFGVEHGALVTSVEPDSPAARAGLKAGDIVTDVDGERVEDAGDLSRAINRKEEGEVTLTVVRERNRRTVRVTPEKMKSPGGELFPGGLRIEAPSIAISMPQVRVAIPPINLSLPSINIQPRPRIAPRVIRPRSGPTIL